jgi:hypothetical protein
MCGCEAAFTIIPFALGDRLAVLAADRSQSAHTFVELIVAWGLVAAIVVLPVALVSGLQFPLLIALLGEGRQTVSRHLGMTYAWNTLGAIAGSLIAGFGAMPLLGAPGMWRAIAIVLVILSAGVLVGAPRIGARGLFAVIGLATVTIGSLFAQGPTAAWRHSGIGAGRSNVAVTEPNATRQWMNQERFDLAWEVDGIESSVGIDRQDGVAFVVNGKIDGNALTDAGTQMGMAILGAVLHDDPKTALVIGLGTGESTGWLAEMRDLERVDVVELEPAIDEVARRCSELNWDVLQHPRIRRIYNDGREFVFTTNEKYDLVLSEPSNPYRAGVAVLYTTEFYEAVRRRLKPGGLFIQWMQAYEVDESIVSTVLVTARSAFPQVEVWQTLPLDLQLVCSSTPLEYSAAQLRQRIALPTIADALRKAWYVDDLEGFLGHYVASPLWVDTISRAPFFVRNTDDRTVLEYSFAKTVGYQTPFSLEEIRGRMTATALIRPSLAGAADVDWTEVELRRQEANLLYHGQFSLALLPKPEHRALLDAFEKYRANDLAGAAKLWPEEFRRPSSAVQALVLAHCYAEQALPECLELIETFEPRLPNEAAALRATYHWRAGSPAESAQWLERFYLLLAENPWVIRRFAEAAMSRTVDVAKADPDLAQRMYDRLSRPFASGCLEYNRLLTRIKVAEHLEPQRVVEALSALEPHVPWTEDILSARAKAYAAVQHPLGRRAERDWKWFERHRVADD